MLTVLLAVLLVLAWPLAGPSPASAVPGSTSRTATGRAAGDRTTQASQQAEYDAVASGPTRLTSSRSRTAVPRGHVDSGTAVLPPVAAPRPLLRRHLPATHVATTLPATRGRTLSRAPPS